MDQPIGDFIIANLQADSVGSVVVRGIIWLVLVTIIAYGVGKGKSHTRIKSEAGFFLLFVILAAAAIYIAFGFIPTLTTIESVSFALPLPTAATAYLLHESNQLHKIASYFLQT